MRDTVVSILMSPSFCFRLDRPGGNGSVRPLPDYDLASRLSYFLWASMPDAELLAHAEAGDLHQPEILTAQARRMLRDDRVRGLATEFLRQLARFPPVRGTQQRRPSAVSDVQRRAAAVDVRGADPLLHRPRPERSAGARAARRQAHVRQCRSGPSLRDARPRRSGPTGGCVSTTRRAYGRGGLLAMAVFLTKNSPGLRTSPVKRGYWVVRRLLGENIPAPAAQRTRASRATKPSSAT